MNRLPILALLFTLFYNVSLGQNSTFIDAGKNIKIETTKLKDNDLGFPIYFAVLRYNDSTILDIEPIDKFFGSYIDNGVKVGYYYQLEVKTMEFSFSGTKIKSDDLFDLVSNHKFNIDKNVLSRMVPLNYTEKHNGFSVSYEPLPKYLKVSVEKIRLK